tara:strand:+ start:1029 stop:1427 length:399 start_codon:yes stop_codon:yes gene_type:complete
MKLTEDRLKEMIKEEMENVLNENFDGKTGLPVTVQGMEMVQKQGGDRFQKIMNIIANSQPQMLFNALLQTKEGSTAKRNAHQAARVAELQPGSERPAEYGGGTMSDDPELEHFLAQQAAIKHVQRKDRDRQE